MNDQELIAQYKSANPQAFVANSPTPTGSTWYDNVKQGAYRPAGATVPTQTSQPNQTPNNTSKIVGGIAGQFASNVNTDLTSAGKSFASAITDVPQRATELGNAIGANNPNISPLKQHIAQGIGTGMAVGESGLRAAGAAAGGLLSFANDAVRAIPGIGSFLDNVGKNFQEQNTANPNAWGPQIIQTLNDFTAKHPNATNDLGSIINIVGAVAGMKGLNEAGARLPEAVATTKGTISDIAQGTKDVVAGAKNLVGAGNADKATWDIVKPNLTPTEQAAAVAEGKIAKTGILGTVEQIPKGRDLEMIEAAKPYVANAKGPIEAVTNMKQAIADKASALRDGLNNTDAIYSKSQITGALKSIEKPTMIASDATLNRAYNIVKNKMVSLVGDGGKLGDLLDARKSFDAFVNKQFPNLYSSDTLTPMRAAILDVRGAINDVIKSRLPKGMLPDGTSFADSLKQQSLLYDAIDNASAKAPKVGSNILTRAESAIRKHPIVAGVAAYEGIKHAANPLSGL